MGERTAGGLSAAWLKRIALALMVLDHLAAFFPERFPPFFRVLGRASYPLFAFCFAESFRHTRDRRRFFGRLYGASVATGALFSLCCALFPSRAETLAGVNIFGTFVTAFVLLSLWERYRERGLQSVSLQIGLLLFAALLAFRLFPALPAALYPAVSGALPLPLTVEGDLTMALIPVFFAASAQRWTRQRYFLSLSLVLLLLNFAGMPNIQGAQVLALPLMLLYNGQRGRLSPGEQWFFYLFYPLHLAALYLLAAV